MSQDIRIASTRRALLAGGVGAALATVARWLGQPDRVDAGNVPVLLNQLNEETNTTQLWNVANGKDVFVASGDGIGVIASSVSKTGLEATTLDGFHAAIYGMASGGGTGVAAFSSIDPSPTPFQPAVRTGLHAEAPDIGVMAIAHASSYETWGVYGKTSSSTGYGLRGEAATNGVGVFGFARGSGGAGGIGVKGSAPGIGVYATADDPMKGFALRANGRVRFDRAAGIATVQAASASVTVTPGFRVAVSTGITATLQDPAGAATVKCVTVNPTANTFVIHLTVAAPTAVKVAWHAFG